MRGAFELQLVFLIRSNNNTYDEANTKKRNLKTIPLVEEIPMKLKVPTPNHIASVA